MVIIVETKFWFITMRKRFYNVLALLLSHSHVIKIETSGQLLKDEIPSAPNRSRTYDLPISTLDALPLSYRRLVVARPLT